MKQYRTYIKVITLYVAISMPFFLSQTAFAASSTVAPIDSFIQSVIEAIAGIAGLVATGFFVVGGFAYITSSGNPEHLDKAKRTLLYSGIGLAITIGAFVLSGIVTTLATKAFGS